MAEADAHDLAGLLAGLVPVLAADPIRGESAIELLFETGWEYLPEPVADVAYRHGYAPVEMGPRTPDHRYAILRPIHE